MADNGLGLILRAMTKIPCYNLFITYSKTLFRTILIKNIFLINFYSEIEELRHKVCVMPFLLTSHILWPPNVACVNDNPSSLWLSAWVV